VDMVRVASVNRCNLGEWAVRLGYDSECICGRRKGY
jgi:hypothetical protein